jgi:hypothetical protein
VNTPALPANDLIFGWEQPGKDKWTIAGFLLASLAVHALGFYLFQIVYPPAVALLPPPGRVSLIAPNSDEGRVLLRWLEAEDPALASNTQVPVDGKSLVMPTIQHAPSYLARQSPLKDIPAVPRELRIPSARPPGPVERATPRSQATAKIVPTAVHFYSEFENLGAAQHPEFKFNASGHESPQAAQFRVAVDEAGEVRYCFLQTSSGDPGLDEQARKYLALCRFPQVANRRLPSPTALSWGTASVEWGNDIMLPSSATPGPAAP